MSERVSAAPGAALDARRGLAAVFSASLWWGLFPIYLRALRDVPALVIVAYRSVLCCAVVLGWLDLGTEPEQVADVLRAYWR